jgi:hypothetical protein
MTGTGSILCIVLALLCVLLGLFDYFRAAPATLPDRGPLFWPLLGILIIEICRMWGGGR